jgi:hypothetical protein
LRAARIFARGSGELATELGTSTDQVARISGAIQLQTARQHAAAGEEARTATAAAVDTVLSNWQDYTAAPAEALQPYLTHSLPIEPVSAELDQLALQHQPLPAGPANLTRRLQRFATNHQEMLTALYRRFGRGSPPLRPRITAASAADHPPSYSSNRRLS